MCAFSYSDIPKLHGADVVYQMILPHYFLLLKCMFESHLLSA